MSRLILDLDLTFKSQVLLKSGSWQAILGLALFRPCFRSCSSARLHRGLDSEVLHISFIKDEEVIEKILKHLVGLWDVKARPPHRAKAPSVTIRLDTSDSQMSFADSFYADPEYPIDSYLS
jgi:hypothetical protein